MNTKRLIADLVWLGLFFLMLGGIAWSMIRLRASLLQGSTVEAQQEWDQWRESVKESAAKNNPVQRRVPASTEPPALVLFRDHFEVCLAIALVLSSVLYGTFVLFARGVMNSSSPPLNSPARQPESPPGA